MALDLDEHDAIGGASYQETRSDNENDNLNHHFSIDHPNASYGLSHGVSHSRGAWVGVRNSSPCLIKQEARGASTHNSWTAPDFQILNIGGHFSMVSLRQVQASR